MTPKAIDGQVRRQEFRRLGWGVYQRADHSHSAAVVLRAAVYGAGPGAVASGLSAAWWHGLLTNPPPKPSVTVPRDRRVKRPESAVRYRDLHRLDVSQVRRLGVTDIPLTILETAVELREGSVFLDRALQKHTSLSILRAVHERNPGRAGAAAARHLLDVAEQGGSSAAERILHQLLNRAGVTGWQSHLWSCGYEIDVAFVRERLAIEVDGWAWHRDAHRFRADMERQNVLVNAGWRVLRFSWHHLNNEPNRVLSEIHTALRCAAGGS
ncbi:DUF559 domain-containing protein [Hoyosella altamirensis]|uniref:Very-short-patch-repair endonuclease n=1 Tax=Hoyosella altamirensis TaxID=616997 RepID=A0A839RQZ7_9ACTN|nr:DUF559 domain-containing protein [Hoyosella altamirensis]MBB3038534.1 very-short-patch-repair endonuclease [Hoyosella altamirensis]